MTSKTIATENVDWWGIETYTGIKFELEDPQFKIEDIAHALSMLCRYNGHCKYFYSVAEHSILVSKLMEDLDLGDPMIGLMHDATEAYMSDIPAPFKKHMPDWKKHDLALEKKLAEEFDLEFPHPSNCKKADWFALFIETNYLIPSQGVGWHDPHGFRQQALKLPYRIHCSSPDAAKYDFLERFKELS